MIPVMLRVLPFLVFFGGGGKGKQNHCKKQGFCIPDEPLKCLKKKAKTLKRWRDGPPCPSFPFFPKRQGEPTKENKDFLSLPNPQIPPPPPICVKWVPFVKLAFSLGNRAHFGSKMGSFSAFSHYVFNDCGPNRGFHSDFALSPILTL